ncbi:MAG: NERD domain-containing protein [Actinomycetia bacterium]|nr:NERD domain-containing protein [Actinomycetes bacterium]
MTARCIPPEPEFQSAAEREAWQRLRTQLPDGAVLFHGLRFSDRKQDREADLVVAWPGVGVAVAEVKGGQVGLADAVWTQSGRGTVKEIHPTDQARICKYLLRNYLSEDRRWRHGWPRLAHLVVFPFTDVPADFAAPDCPRWMVVGKGDLDDAAGRVWDALRWVADQPPPPTAEQVDDLVECLAGRMLPQVDLVAAAEERERVCDLLTERQAKVLDTIRLMPRVEVRGGAGSGKTWLAVERARRLAAGGQRVGLVCYSRGLAAFLQRRVELFAPTERPAYVGTFHGLGVDWLDAPPGSDDDSDYWERRLPEAMRGLAEARAERDRFDAFVVDEAQDFADAWWPALLAALRDPDHGGLTVFADEGQRVFARQGRPPVPLAEVPLDENLRNTRQIAQTFGSLAPEQMRYRGGDGPPVRFVPCATDDAVGVASDAADALLDEGWAKQHVTLLTTGRRHPVQVERQEHGQDAYWASYWDDDDLFYGHVLGFKGLERPAVVLAVNGFRDRTRAQEMLYVGLSRARDLLVVCGDPTLVREVGGEAVAIRLGCGRKG